MPSETHRTMTPGLPYRCITAPRAHPEWVGQTRLAEDWPRSTAAQYEALLLGEYLRHLRESEGVSRRTVAARCRVGKTTVRDWEIRGKVPRFMSLASVAYLVSGYTMGNCYRQILSALTRLRDADQEGRAAARDWEREHVYRLGPRKRPVKEATP